MRKRYWIAAGVAVAAVGATAIAANAYRGQSHEWRGGGYEDSEDGRHGWRGRWFGSASKEEFDARTRSKFAEWDVNGDGVVDQGEAETRVAKRMERRMRHRGGRMMRRMLRHFDADRDGRVTQTEVEARVAEFFARVDLDSDGRITDADLPPFLRGRNILSGEGRPGRAMGRRWGRHGGGRGRGFKLRRLIGADVNKDNAITLEELQDHAALRFKRFDRNGDGAVDAADREAFAKEMVDYRVRRFMHRFGASKSGELTLEQFKVQRDKRFARLDADGDGTISGDEQGRHRWGRRRQQRDEADYGDERRGEDSLERRRPADQGDERRAQ